MKTVVCFGDSNTWGYIPGLATRYNRDVRWTGRLQKLLGDQYHIVEEGMNGRTTVFEDPTSQCKNGREGLKYVLESQFPMDLIVLMLGTNDVKSIFNLSPFHIAKGMQTLITEVKQYSSFVQQNTQILLASPVHVGSNIQDTDIAEHFGIESVEKSKQLEKYYRDIAELCGCEFLVASKYAEPDPIDAIHLSEDNHRKLAEAFAQKIKSMLE